MAVCPRCNGTGKVWSPGSSGPGGCGGSLGSNDTCEVCEGVGAAIIGREWVPARQCYCCGGSGYEKIKVPNECYPSGKVINYREESIRCSSCEGAGKHAGYYITTGRPDYSARKGGGGLCFLTTACLRGDMSDQADATLNTLRVFREKYVRQQPGGNTMISDYYYLSPKIVNRIDECDDKDAIYRELYKTLVAPCVTHIRAGENVNALNLYRTTVQALIARFLWPPPMADGSGI